MIILTLVSMESSHLVIFLTSDKFLRKFNVLCCISLRETLFWTEARDPIPIILTYLAILNTEEFIRDINLMLYYLTAFELINQLLYINFPSLEPKIFLKDLKSTCCCLLHSDFVMSVLFIHQVVLAVQK